MIDLTQERDVDTLRQISLLLERENQRHITKPLQLTAELARLRSVPERIVRIKRVWAGGRGRKARYAIPLSPFDGDHIDLGAVLASDQRTRKGTTAPRAVVSLSFLLLSSRCP